MDAVIDRVVDRTLSPNAVDRLVAVLNLIEAAARRGVSTEEQ
ncbi:MAG: hypothetical protein ACR2N6_08825 [Miltoncostaeaceae bacterium]